MDKVLLLVDNSNIFVSSMNRYDKNVRFSYSDFEKMLSKNSSIIEKHMAGSTPPANDAFWGKMSDRGYKVHLHSRVSAGKGRKREKSVDVALAIAAGSAIERLRPDRVVILSGDRDFLPLADLRDTMMNDTGSTFILEAWSYSDSLSGELEKVCDTVFLVEDYEEKLIYFQYEDGATETFLEREERITLEEKERVEQREKLYARRALEEEQRKLAREERTAKWIEYGKIVLAFGGPVLAALGVSALLPSLSETGSQNDKGCDWHCDNCDDFMNSQAGFTTFRDEWSCSICGFVNDVSDANIRHKNQTATK